MPLEGEAPLRFAERLQALNYVRLDDVYRDGKLRVVRLTENGHRYAALNTGRTNGYDHSDNVAPDMMLHLLKTAELWLHVVLRDVTRIGDWVAVRRNASDFEWKSSNEATTFEWKQPTSVRTADATKRLIPDATLETERQRFMVEIERSTKTLAVVERKFEHYSHLFSPNRVRGDRPAYFQKYGDEKTPVVLFVLDSDARCEHVRALFEKRAREPNFFVPSWSACTLDQAAALLGKKLGKPEAKTPAAPDVKLDELRAQARVFLQHVVEQRQLSSLHFPPNWRKLGELVIPSGEWEALAPQIEERMTAARARGAAVRGTS